MILLYILSLVNRSCLLQYNYFVKFSKHHRASIYFYVSECTLSAVYLLEFIVNYVVLIYF